MKIRAVAVVLVAVGCASPKSAALDPTGSSSPDLSGFGTGGNAGDDLGGGGGGGGAAIDLAAATVVDLAMAPLAPPDLAQPPGPPDMAQLCSPPSGSACVVYPQCGCSTTQSCDITDTTGNGVCVVAGGIADWNLCTGSGQCKKGSTCTHGVCTPFCATVGTPSVDCSANSAECYQLQDGTQTPAVDIPHDKVCSLNCDPTNPQNATGYSPCGPNVNCWPDSDHYAWCLGPTTASGTQGKDCTNSLGTATDPTRCAVGYNCVAGTSSATCYKQCHAGQSGECPGSTSCRSFSTRAYAGALEIGYCK